MKKYFLILTLITFWYRGQITAIISCVDLECAKQKFYQSGLDMPIYDKYEITTTNEPEEL